MNKQRILVKQYPSRSSIYATGMVNQIWQEVDGTFSVTDAVDESALTPEQLEEYRNAILVDEYGADFYDQQPDPEYRWPTADLAEKWADLADQMSFVGEEAQAFGAPGECLTDIYRSIEDEMNGLLKYAVMA